MGYQDDREKRIQIFEDTIRCCESMRSLSAAVMQTRTTTILYRQPLLECAPVFEMRFADCTMTESQEQLQEAAIRLHGNYPANRLGVLNFASTVNPGGGVLRGDNAQEECLCRCSTLYPCLRTRMLMENYYSCRGGKAASWYKNACIYTPGILCFRRDADCLELMPESEWFSMDVISCGVPVLRECSLDQTERRMQEVLYEGIRGSVQVALENGVDVLAAGIPGQGILYGLPYTAAQVLKEVLEEYRCCFKEIVLAIGCTSSAR